MFKADDYRLRAKALADTLQETKEALDIDILVGKLARLKAEQEKPEVWQDLEKSTKLGREISSVEGKIHSYEKGKKALEEVNSVIDLIEETEEEDLVPELESLLKTVEEDLEEMRIRTLLRGKYDANNALLTLHSGAGGTESCDWVSMLYRMYSRWVEHKGFNGELMGCMSREIKTFFDLDNAPFSKMVLGEVLNLPGKWSSYPPHHHPQPEVYFYRFDYPDGFGAGFANGEIFKTQHNGCAVINHGFHSQTAAPGYAMCYAWGIRHLDGDPWDKTRIDDPEHAWLWKADANDHIYPNH